MSSSAPLRVSALFLGASVFMPCSAAPAADDPTTAKIVEAGLAGTTNAKPDTQILDQGPSDGREQELWASYYAAAKFAYDNRRDAFAWQAITTKITFILVVVLVLFGAVLTALQFTRKSASVTALKASTGGIEVTSPLVGVIILTLSLGFFYLYLANVYPIHDLAATAASAPHREDQR